MFLGVEVDRLLSPDPRASFQRGLGNLFLKDHSSKVGAPGEGHTPLKQSGSSVEVINAVSPWPEASQDPALYPASRQVRDGKCVTRQESCCPAQPQRLEACGSGAEGWPDMRLLRSSDGISGLGPTQLEAQTVCAVKELLLPAPPILPAPSLPHPRTHRPPPALVSGAARCPLLMEGRWQPLRPLLSR